MTVASRLACALGRNDERPNIALAEELAQSGDAAAVSELVHLLTAGDKPQRHDAIKVLYELGERRPSLVAPYAQAFVDLLATHDNRMLWGTMHALATIVGETPAILLNNLEAILAAADRGSVIAKDNAIRILSGLNADPRYADRITLILFERLEHAADNQFPMYAEYAAPTVGPEDLHAFTAILERRRQTIPQPAKQRRIDKLLTKLHRAK